MYIYKTEILTVSTKQFQDKANAEDISMLDKLKNERASDGWELVYYILMSSTRQSAIVLFQVVIRLKIAFVYGIIILLS